MPFTSVFFFSLSLQVENVNCSLRDHSCSSKLTKSEKTGKYQQRNSGQIFRFFPVFFFLFFFWDALFCRAQNRSDRLSIPLLLSVLVLWAQLQPSWRFLVLTPPRTKTRILCTFQPNLSRTRTKLDEVATHWTGLDRDQQNTNICMAPQKFQSRVEWRSDIGSCLPAEAEDSGANIPNVHRQHTIASTGAILIT